MSKLPVLFLLFLAAFCLVSCSGSGSMFSSTGTPADVPITLSMQDAVAAGLPSGVTIVSFEIDVKNASLAPGNVSLLVKDADIELTHLQSEPALIGSLSVPAGTYTSLSATFDSTAQIALINNSGSSITIGSTSCPSTVAPTATAATICKGSITVNPTSINFSSAPFPITLSANSPLGFLLHFDLGQSLTNGGGTLSVSPTVDVKELMPQSGVVHTEHLAGTITDVSSPPDFTLQPGLGAPMPIADTLPPTFLIKTNSNTKYNFQDFHATCATPGFSCLAKGQTVKATVDVMSDGSLLATVVSLFEQTTPAFEGIVLKVDPTNSQFLMALLGGQWGTGAAPTASAAIGVLLTVTVSNSTVFEVDSDGFTLPSGLSFNSIADMIPGQTVEVQVNLISAGSANSPLPLTTQRVRLDETQVTSTVASTNPSGTPPSFTLNNLLPLFSYATINVDTITSAPPTQFVNVSGVSGLSVGDKVSVGGLLFNVSGTPTLGAEVVLRRFSCSAVASTAVTVTSCVLPPQ